jgi:hypothetical protein
MYDLSKLPILVDIGVWADSGFVLTGLVRFFDQLAADEGRAGADSMSV